MIITTGTSEERRQRIPTDPVRKEIRMFDAENLVKKEMLLPYLLSLV